ncbi:helix-turn-helix domain-containing protein [Romboutsia lituseburensis]|uniref:helix-turn-helix domain-containing protein n=1 Tax=Romboutsia lituseburensis TaxID=1537 RepID=UPI00215A9F45|nr:helix-turn-helix domain-containing protein [Romboutsia lituseburensis]MCR8746211.1 helix-turn-helix domain-containing protein [Romboutsia lituseburensis]
MNIGDNIKKYRKKNKITQTELANKLNKSLRTIQKYESNHIVPSLKVLNDISEALNINVNDLTDKGNHGLSSITKSREASKHYKEKPINNDITKLDIYNSKDIQLLFDKFGEKYIDENNKSDNTSKYDEIINNYTDNMSYEELITSKYKIDFSEELNNQIPLHDKINPKQLEMIYISKINDLKSIIKGLETQIDTLKSMNNLQKDMIDTLKSMNNIYGGGTDGE